MCSALDMDSWLLLLTLIHSTDGHGELEDEQTVVDGALPACDPLDDIVYESGGRGDQRHASMLRCWLSLSWRRCGLAIFERRCGARAAPPETYAD